jgi:hypothetical protein
MVNRNVAYKGSEAEFRIIAPRMNGANNFTKILERLFRHVVVAKGDIQVYVTRGFNFTLQTWTNRTELDFIAIET